jgi:hypothetical protein
MNEGQNMRVMVQLRCQISATLITVALVFLARPASGVDLSGSSRFLCVPIQATVCVEDGGCAVDLPWNLNIPQFIEIDLDSKRLATTEACGLNRETTIERLRRVDGTIAFDGFETGRAFGVCLEAKKYPVKYYT